ncbi:hypothetical protein D3C81_1792440 [compost metagenome]
MHQVAGHYRVGVSGLIRMPLAQRSNPCTPNLDVSGTTAPVLINPITSIQWQFHHRAPLIEAAVAGTIDQIAGTLPFTRTVAAVSGLF